MGDVTEILLDSLSGLSPGNVEGTCLAAGVCSLGEPGKAYPVGRRSDLASILGTGPLVDALRDLFAAAGQDATVAAVPVAGSPGGYVTACRHEGTGPAGESSGPAVSAAEVRAVVTIGGANGAATVKISLDGGETFDEDHITAVPADGVVAIPGTGARLRLFGTAEAPLVLDDAYSFSVVTPLSQHRQDGPGPLIEAEGEPTAGGELRLLVIKGGGLNEGTCRISVDGGDSYGPARTLPADAAIEVPELGVTLALEEGDYEAGTLYSWEVLAPVPTTAALMEALAGPLEKYDVEFVHAVGPSDSVDWAAAAALAEEQWNKHRPVFFIFETRRPRAGEDLADWTNALLAEREGFASIYVSAVAAFGETADSSGLSKTRSWGGLFAGKNLAIPVNQAAGWVAAGPVSQAALPDGYNESVQQILENAGYVTAKRYAGLSGVYWGDSRTLADAASDFLYLEVLRTTFKAFRLCRVAALKQLYGSAGDPLADDPAGLAYVKSLLAAALDSMVKAVPAELAGYEIDIPGGQDIANNGLAVELTFIGIPIIRAIKLYGRYVYAGGPFDPRQEIWNVGNYSGA